jgi:DNA-binding response OmpR family regulator
MERMQYEKLKELDHLKSRFFADISHEFRTPLTLILGPLENLISGALKGNANRQYLMMKRNAQRLLRLINQLLDLSKLEAGKMTLEARYENIIPLIKGIFNSFESLGKRKGISLHFETEAATALLYFDRDKMEQIITNLLSNAFKFTPEGGTVSIKIKNVSTEQAGAFLQIEVADTGTGIPAAKLPHVFDRFYQGGDSYRKDEQGSGIGLALTKELVELHHGWINVNSTVGQGSQFIILLPFGKNHLQAEEIIEERADRPLPTEETRFVSDPDTIGTINEPFSESRAPQSVSADHEEVADENIILLVEDNADMRAFLYNQLTGTYRVLEAADGQEGMEKAIQYIPDLIISDVMMPGIDGLQLCDTLKNDERTSHIPIILLTARTDIASRLAGLERGADAYLAKPFNREELLIRSRKLLELRKRLRERYATLQPPALAEDKGLQMEDAFLQKVLEIVTQHLSDIDFDMDRLSRSLGMSRSQIFRKIKALTGKSPSLFIRAIRLNQAKELLQTTDMNVSEVAYEVGFSTPAYFSDTFLETFGIRPSELRK